jgi:hypothetical protein
MLGLLPQGVLRGLAFISGRWRDGVLYARLRGRHDRGRTTDSRILRPRRSRSTCATCCLHSVQPLVVRDYLQYRPRPGHRMLTVPDRGTDGNGPTLLWLPRTRGTPGMLSRKDSHRWVRQLSPTRPRSRTTCSTPRALRATLVASPAGPAPTRTQSISTSRSPHHRRLLVGQLSARTIPRAMPSPPRAGAFRWLASVASAVTECDL